MQILQAYQPSDFFILLVIDLNGEIWLYQQALKQGHNQANSVDTKSRAAD